MAETIEPTNTAQANTPEEQTPKRVLIVMAHPDDGEFGCGGTVAKWAAEGRDICYCLLPMARWATGRQGDYQRAARRQAPHRGAGRRRCAGRATSSDLSALLGFAAGADAGVATRYRPRDSPGQARRGDLPGPDGAAGTARATSIIPTTASRARRRWRAIMPVASTRLAFPELAAEGLATHNVREIYITGTQSADRWVDIGGYVEKKVEALRQHVSQLRGWDPQEGITQWAKEGGAAARKHGHDFTYAEGFKYIRLEDD